MADQHRDQVALQLRGAGLLAPGVGEAVQQPDAPVELDQQRHDRGEGQHLGQLGLERDRLARDVLGGQRGDHQLAGVVEADRAVTRGQDLLELTERPGQLVGDRGQRDRRVGGLADELAERRPMVAHASVVSR